MADMDQEALSYLVSLGKQSADVATVTFGDRSYTNKEIKPVNEPLVTALRISTLGSLIELCSGKFGSSSFEGFSPTTHLIHVVDEKYVQVISAKSDSWKNREVLIDCVLTETTGIEFGKFHTQDKFIIALLSAFAGTADRDGLAKLAGNATAEQVTTAIDDGITQMISMRAGAALQDTTVVKGLVKLAPWRTFRDVDQPESTFVFRVQKVGDMPQFALFEADGSAWKLQAVANIARKLSAGLTGATVVS